MSFNDQNLGRTDDHVGTSRDPGGNFRRVICVLLVILGIALGVIALALVSNMFGNTDIIGLPLVGLAGGVLTTGISHLFFRFRTAALIGLLAAPFAIVLLIVLFWLILILTAVVNATLSSSMDQSAQDNAPYTITASRTTLRGLLE